MSKYQFYRNRYPLGIVVFSLIAGTLSLILHLAGGSDLTVWFSQYLLTLSAVGLGILLLGTVLLDAFYELMGELVNHLGDHHSPDYREEFLGLQRELDKIQNQNDLAMRQLENLESQLSSLEDNLID